MFAVVLIGLIGLVPREAAVDADFPGDLVDLAQAAAVACAILLWCVRQLAWLGYRRDWAAFAVIPGINLGLWVALLCLPRRRQPDRHAMFWVPGLCGILAGLPVAAAAHDHCVALGLTIERYYAALGSYFAMAGFIGSLGGAGFLRLFRSFAAFAYTVMWGATSAVLAIVYMHPGNPDEADFAVFFASDLVVAPCAVESIKMASIIMVYPVPVLGAVVVLPLMMAGGVVGLIVAACSRVVLNALVRRSRLGGAPAGTGQ